MDLEDDRPTPAGDSLSTVENEALDALGVAELETRIRRLKSEIVRTEAALAARADTRKAADALFSGSR